VSRIGLICPSVAGHLNPMMALGRELQRRGHDVVVIGPVDSQAKVNAAGLGFAVIGEAEYPRGAVAQRVARLGELSGRAALRYTVDLYVLTTRVVLRDGPGVIQRWDLDFLLIDQTSTAGTTVAELLGIPFVTVCNALMMNQEDGVPPFATPWQYNPAWWARWRNRAGYWYLARLLRPIANVLADYRTRHGLPRHSCLEDRFSRLAQISQQPAEFEFPRVELPRWFHFAGPFHDPQGRESVSFPFDKLTGQPLIYASMGTLQNRQLTVVRAVSAACQAMDVQLVISLGGAEQAVAGDLPGRPLVVSYAPQLELLKRAALVITHAGLNTVLEALSHGVPMVAIPITNDQPGVAARLLWSKAGEVVPRSRVCDRTLREAIHRVLTTASYRTNAQRLQQAIAKSGGAGRAGEIAEQALTKGLPVIAQSAEG
jgi:MGT family glycosyltransferase